MADSTSTADEVQSQVEAPEVEDQTTDSDDANLEDDATSFEDVADDGKPYGDADDSDEDDLNVDDDDEDDGFGEDTKDDAEEESKEEQSDDEAKADESDTEKAQQMSDEERKEHNRKMAEQRLADREQTKVKRDQLVSAKKQEYVDAATTPEEADKRAMEVELYDGKVERVTNKLVSASDRAFKDFPILSDPDPVIQKSVARAIDQFEKTGVVIDAFGNPVNITGDLYTHLQEEAESIAALTGKGAREQVKSKAKEKSKAFTPPTRKPKQPKSDPMIEGFDEEANRY